MQSVAELAAAIGFSQQKGSLAEAFDYAEQLARLAPDDTNLRNLIARLRGQGAPFAPK
jgi:hypothetical protein